MNGCDDRLHTQGRNRGFEGVQITFDKGRSNNGHKADIARGPSRASFRPTSFAE